MSVNRQRRDEGLATGSWASGRSAAGNGVSSVFQSEGAYSIPQKLPGTSSSRPRSQVSGSPPSGTTSATRAVVCRFAETISNRTRTPRAISRCVISPHPCAFTSVVLHGSENATAGSRLVTRTGTSNGNRVLRRMACCCFSEGSIVEQASSADDNFFGQKILTEEPGCGAQPTISPRSC